MAPAAGTRGVAGVGGQGEPWGDNLCVRNSAKFNEIVHDALSKVQHQVHASMTSLTSASVPDGFWEAYRATRDEQIEAVIDPNSQAAS
jgi:hypothetical protein